MRIKTLELKPFGHLSNARLDLAAPSGGPGLHVIRGRNGAGKSTTMRALEGALFGIPRQTPHTHTHLGPALKVSVALEAQDGRVLRFDRRKRNGPSIFTTDGQPVDGADLQEMLRGLPHDEFQQMFLLDCDMLEAGSEDLLAAKGLLGQALFGAAIGFGRVHEVLAELEREAEALWVKGGTREVTQQIKLLTQARQAKRKDGLTADQLKQLQAELDDTEEALAALKIVQRDLGERLDRTIRHQRCLPILVRRNDVQVQLLELHLTRSLPASFATDVITAREDLDAEIASIADATEELDRVNGELKANPEPDLNADREAAVNTLYRRAGESAKAAEDLPRREAELAVLNDKLPSLLARAGLPDLSGLDQLRISDADRTRLGDLSSDRAALDKARETADEEVGRLKRRLAGLAGRGLSAPTLSAAAHDALAEAIEAALAVGDAETLAKRARQAATECLAAAARASATLPLWQGDVDNLERVVVPSTTTVQRFESEYAELERAADRLQDRRAELDKRLGMLENEKQAFASGVLAPVRAEVITARERRDQTLVMLIELPSTENQVALRADIRNSDELADARADHAEESAKRERLQYDTEQLKADEETFAHDQSVHELTRADFARRWAEQWPSLAAAPLAPAEMRDWMIRRTEIIATVNQARQETASAENTEQVLSQHRHDLSEFLNNGDADADNQSFKQLLREAKVLLAEESELREAAVQHERDRKQVAEDLSDAQARVTQAEADLVAWGADWTPLVQALGLTTTATPSEVRAQLAAVDDLISTFDQAATFERRIQKLRQDEADFADAVRELVDEVAPDLAGTEPLSAADLLHSRAATARTVRAARQQLVPQHRHFSQQIAAAETHRDAADELLKSFAQQAAVSVDALGELCERLERQDVLSREMRDIDKELVAAGSASIADLVTELDGLTADQLAADRATDEAEAPHLDEQRSELERTAGALRDRLANGGGDAAALAAEQEVQARAAVVDGYERYTELVIASAFLRDGIERHRKQNEGPLLHRAGELFAKLTGGVMSGLTVVTTEKQPYIMGVKSDGREVHVDAMSTGQRHQLFLALRLASLERHFEHNEPMPLILDDLLVQLDDVSARAALEILVELSRTVQVLFFTHHEHLVTMARETVPSELLVEHLVGDTTVPALQAA